MIFLRVSLANTWCQRVLGWMGKKDFKSDDALLIPNCRRVHTFFMRRPIDVVFLDQKKMAIAIIATLPPWHVSPLFSTANHSLELPAGRAAELQIKPGTIINFVGVDSL